MLVELNSWSAVAEAWSLLPEYSQGQGHFLNETLCATSEANSLVSSKKHSTATLRPLLSNCNRSINESGSKYS